MRELYRPNYFTILGACFTRQTTAAISNYPVYFPHSDNAPVRFSVSGAKVSATRLEPDEGTLPHYSPFIPFGACFPCQTAAAISNYPVCMLYCLTAVVFCGAGGITHPYASAYRGRKFQPIG